MYGPPVVLVGDAGAQPARLEAEVEVVQPRVGDGLAGGALRGRAADDALHDAALCVASEDLGHRGDAVAGEQAVHHHAVLVAEGGGVALGAARDERFHVLVEVAVSLLGGADYS